MTNTHPHQPTTRLDALDGLRGAAALIVVFWHALLTTRLPERPPELLGSSDSTVDPTAGSLAWWLFDTPLRVLSMGINAVSVFFVLSGFVLAIPVFRGAMLNLWNYYPRRILRLWVPSAAAMVFAMVVISLTHQDPDNAASEWGAQFSFSHLDPQTVLRSFFLITGSNDYNNPLWSLKWEMLFSLFLPVALVVGLRLRGVAALWLGILACAAISAIGEGYQVSAAQYGSMFIAGVLAARLVSVRRDTPRPALNWTFAIGGIVLIAIPDMYRTLFDADMHAAPARPLGGFVVLGATLLVYALTGPSLLARLFASAPLRYLGRISFSLYLVHAPLLLAGVHVFGNAVLSLWVTIPLAGVVAVLFTRFVEQPSARLARTAGVRSAQLMAQAPAAADPVHAATR